MATELAVVVIGGLFSSTLLTLLVIPVFTAYLEVCVGHLLVVGGILALLAMRAAP